jgi:hypothetical protein
MLLLKKPDVAAAHVKSYWPVANLSVLEQLVAKQLVSYLSASGSMSLPGRTFPSETTFVELKGRHHLSFLFFSFPYCTSFLSRVFLLPNLGYLFRTIEPSDYSHITLRP